MRHPREYIRALIDAHHKIGEYTELYDSPRDSVKRLLTKLLLDTTGPLVFFGAAATGSIQYAVDMVPWAFTALAWWVFLVVSIVHVFAVYLDQAATAARDELDEYVEDGAGPWGIE